MTRFITIVLFLMISAYSVAAQEDTIEVSNMATTHIVFSSELKYVDISNKVLVARIVDNGKNILAMKARTPFQFITTISILESNGKLHTYFVQYNENPEELIYDIRQRVYRDDYDAVQPMSNEVSDSLGQEGEPTERGLLERPRQLYHIGDRNSGISAYCENIFVYDEYMYFIFSLSNKSQIRYEMSDASFVVENGRKSRRAVNMDKTLAVANSYGVQSVESSGTRRFYYKIPKFTLDKKLVLRIYIYEERGARNLVLEMGADEVNKAVGW